MAKRKKITGTIIAAYAEPAAGPGWSNTPLWLIVRENGELRQECLQPEEQTAEIMTLYSISAATHTALTYAARAAVGKGEKP